MDFKVLEITYDQERGTLQISAVFIELVISIVKTFVRRFVLPPKVITVPNVSESLVFLATTFMDPLLKYVKLSIRV